MAKHTHPSSMMLKTFLLCLIKAYRFALSCLVGNVCRFEPSCSAYAVEAIEYHGCIKGLMLILRRILRCHPFHPGGIDRVPKP